MVPLYIDPGTGSMLFAVLIGIASAVSYVFRSALIKLKFIFSGGKVSADKETIPFVIFSDDKRYWSIFEPVIKELSNRGISTVYYTASQDDPALKADIPGLAASYSGDGNKTFAKMNLLNATIVLSTTPGLDVYQWKRSKSVQYYVHMFHSAGTACLYRVFGLDYYDAILASGQHQIDDVRNLEKLRGLPEKEAALIGIPYLDVMREKLLAAPPQGSHVRTVLLSPSWGPSSMFSKYGSRIIDALLETGYHIIVRPHPQSFKSETELIEGLMSKYPNSDQLEWNRDVDNFDCLRRAHIMVSDFSGIMLEYALVHDKPFIYADTEFDAGPYDAYWLDYEPWSFGAYNRMGMKLSLEGGQSLKEAIDTCLNDPRFAEAREQVRKETWSYQGEGAIKVADYIEAKLHQLTHGDAEE